jgi:hypothetical protein
MRANETLSDDAYSEIMKRLTAIENVLKLKQHFEGNVFFDNQEFIQLMHISKKTASIWRQNNLIAYSQVVDKIYYRLDDIMAMLEKHRISEKSL